MNQTIHRKCPVIIRATEAEKESWKQQASRHGTTVSALVRNYLNGLAAGAVTPVAPMPLPVHQESLPTNST
jgi:hypothetical protein